MNGRLEFTEEEQNVRGNPGGAKHRSSPRTRHVIPAKAGTYWLQDGGIMMLAFWRVRERYSPSPAAPSGAPGASAPPSGGGSADAPRCVTRAT